MRTLQRTIKLSVGLVLVLAACGRTSTQPAVQPASQRGQRAVVNTATAIVLTPTLAKKFVFDTQVAISIATELALSPTPYMLDITFPPQPSAQMSYLILVSHGAILYQAIVGLAKVEMSLFRLVHRVLIHSKAESRFYMLDAQIMIRLPA